MIARSALVLIATTAIGCGPDSVPFGVSLSFDRPGIDGAGCPGNSCMQFEKACAVAVSLRVVEVGSDTELYDDCVMLPPGGDLCALGELDLGGELFPNTMVKIQIAIWPYVESEDPLVDTSRCPGVEFDLAGKYKSGTPTPALAGEGYFRVGSSGTASIVLGCIDAAAVNAEACQIVLEPQITAIVRNFDALDFSVPPELENRLTVQVAEPRANIVPDQWVIRSSELVELGADLIGEDLIWTGEYPFPFTETACIQVLRDDLGAAATVRCFPAAPNDLVDNELVAEGVLLDDATLDLIQQALGGEPLPNSGLVVGKVLDHTGVPASNVLVTPSFGTIQYLSDDLTSTVGLIRTTSSGVFVSTDAPFAGDTGETNFWTATDDIVESVGVVIGGRVVGKVTILILQLDDVANPR